ncbi:MAG: hypothetical protein ACLRMZ_24315 [Blautia marasmi]
MKKQSFGIILAAVLGAGSLFSAVIPGTDALLLLLCLMRELFRYRPKLPTALADPAVRKMTLSGFAASEFSLVLDEADLLYR